MSDIPQYKLPNLGNYSLGINYSGQRKFINSMLLLSEFGSKYLGFHFLCHALLYKAVVPDAGFDECVQSTALEFKTTAQCVRANISDYFTRFSDKLKIYYPAAFAPKLSDTSAFTALFDTFAANYSEYLKNNR